MIKIRLARRTLKACAVLAILGVLGIGLLLGSLLLDQNRETILPTPTGPFAVGRTAFVWSNASRADPLVPQSGTKRELIAWIWYPA